MPTEEGEGAEIRRPIVKATAVVEQRISHFVMGLAIIGTMTGPLLIVLHAMPAAVFAGVFFIVGWGSVGSSGIMQKAIHLIQENRFVQRDEPLLKVRNHKILLWVLCQLIAVAACVAISETIAAIGILPTPFGFIKVANRVLSPRLSRTGHRSNTIPGLYHSQVVFWG